MSTWLRHSRAQLKHTLTPSHFLPLVRDQGMVRRLCTEEKMCHTVMPQVDSRVDRYKQVAGPFVCTCTGRGGWGGLTEGSVSDRCIWRRRSNAIQIQSFLGTLFVDVAVTNSTQEVIKPCTLPRYCYKHEASSLRAIYGTPFSPCI